MYLSGYDHFSVWSCLSLSRSQKWLIQATVIMFRMEVRSWRQLTQEPLFCYLWAETWVSSCWWWPHQGTSCPPGSPGPLPHHQMKCMMALYTRPEIMYGCSTCLFTLPLYHCLLSRGCDQSECNWYLFMVFLFDSTCFGKVKRLLPLWLSVALRQRASDGLGWRRGGCRLWRLDALSFVFFHAKIQGAILIHFNVWFLPGLHSKLVQGKSEIIRDRYW